MYDLLFASFLDAQYWLNLIHSSRKTYILSIKRKQRQKEYLNRMKLKLALFDVNLKKKSDLFSTMNASFYPSYYYSSNTQSSIQFKSHTEHNEWIPDKDAKECMSCHESRFSVLIRIHHCRECGWVICWKCSRFRDVIGLKDDKEQSLTSNGLIRICKECDDDLLKSLSLKIV